MKVSKRRRFLRSVFSAALVGLGFNSQADAQTETPEDVVLNGSLADLLPTRPAPRTPPKRTKEVEARIISMRFETDGTMYAIAEALTQLGFTVSARLVAQVLADYGLSKKNA